MFIRDHFAAAVACIACEAKVIECNIRAGWNNQAKDNLQALEELSARLARLIEKWNDRIDS